MADHDHDGNVRRLGLCPVCAVDPPPPPPDAAQGEASCAFCGLPVVVMDARTYHQQSGWTRPRQQGGTNALALRQTVPGRYAHTDCIEAAKRGRLNQPALPEF